MFVGVFAIETIQPWLTILSITAQQNCICPPLSSALPPPPPVRNQAQSSQALPKGILYISNQAQVRTVNGGPNDDNVAYQKSALYTGSASEQEGHFACLHIRWASELATMLFLASRNHLYIYSETCFCRPCFCDRPHQKQI
jgi:hypothetical protein